jgi:hypothetical protein
MMQSDSRDSTPSPCTGGDSNGGRDLPERGGARLQNSDDSEEERKREGLGCCALVVWWSVASRGPIYRDGREWELGYPTGGGSGGKKSGRGGFGNDVGSQGRVMGDAAPPLAGWRRLLTSAMSPRVRSDR